MKKKTKAAAAAAACAALAAAGGWAAYTRSGGLRKPAPVAPAAACRYEYWGDEWGGSEFGEIVTKSSQKTSLDRTRKLAATYVREGDEVAIGDPLFAYDSELLELKMEMEGLERKQLEIELSLAEKELSKLGYDPSYAGQAKLELPPLAAGGASTETESAGKTASAEIEQGEPSEAGSGEVTAEGAEAAEGIDDAQDAPEEQGPPPKEAAADGREARETQEAQEAQAALGAQGIPEAAGDAQEGGTDTGGPENGGGGPAEAAAGEPDETPDEIPDEAGEAGDGDALADLADPAGNPAGAIAKDGEAHAPTTENAADDADGAAGSPADGQAGSEGEAAPAQDAILDAGDGGADEAGREALARFFAAARAVEEAYRASSSPDDTSVDEAFAEAKAAWDEASTPEGGAAAAETDVFGFERVPERRFVDAAGGDAAAEAEAKKAWRAATRAMAATAAARAASAAAEGSADAYALALAAADAAWEYTQATRDAAETVGGEYAIAAMETLAQETAEDGTLVAATARTLENGTGRDGTETEPETPAPEAGTESAWPYEPESGEGLSSWFEEETQGDGPDAYAPSDEPATESLASDGEGLEPATESLVPDEGRPEPWTESDEPATETVLEGAEGAESLETETETELLLAEKGTSAWNTSAPTGDARPEGREAESETETETVPETETEWPDDWDDGYGFDDFGFDDADEMTPEERREAILDAIDSVRELRLQIAESKMETKEYERKIEECVVRASVDGIVTLVDEDAGAYDDFVVVTGGGGLYVSGALTETQAATAKIGTTIVGQSHETGEQFTATIAEISPYPAAEGTYYGFGGDDDESRYPFLAYVDRQDAVVEGSAEYSVRTEGEESTGFYLESCYVRTEADGTRYVMVSEDGRLAKRRVKTGKTVDGVAEEILGGLRPSDLIAFPYGDGEKAGTKTKEVDSLASAL